VGSFLAALEAIPKIVDLLNSLVGKVDALVIAQENKKNEEIKAGLSEIRTQVEGVLNDEQRMAINRRLSDLERRILNR
jgi:hypothetical protein